jgi:hypothetical protein
MAAKAKNKQAWKEFEKELIEKYGEDYRSKWNPAEFRTYMKLKDKKLPGMSRGAYAHHSSVIVNRRESGVYHSHK